MARSSRTITAIEQNHSASESESPALAGLFNTLYIPLGHTIEWKDLAASFRMSFFDQFQSKTIRRDIEGLRALAVLSVMLYHYDIAPFSGGFVGVDIFFVISGYLISHQIKSEIERGTFSIALFYERRIRRILPALYTCLIVSYVAAYFIFFPPEMEAFDKSAFATVAFFANFHFWKAYQNYFAPASEMAPLLHTWSLAVEEQFYFLAPACLLILSRLKRTVLSVMTVAGLLLSLGLAEWMIRLAPSLVFYFTPARAWEFLIGTLLAFEPRIAERFQHKSLALWVGAVCLLAPIFVFYSGIRFPGAYAIIPVFGAFIIIAFGKGSPTHPVVSWLSVRPMTLIGLLSYSLYLWHWPILVFAKTSLGDDLSLVTRILLLACVVSVAAFFFIVIEDPIRKKKILSGRKSLLGTIASVSLVLLLYAHVDAKRGGETFKSQSADLKLETSADIFDINCFLIGDTSYVGWNENACRLTDGGRSKILLWGDSTAAHYGYGIKIIAPFHDVTVYLYAMSACLPVLGYESLGRPFCRQFNDYMLSHAKQLGIQKIVIAGRWDTAYRSHVKVNSIADTIAELERNGFQVEILALTPLFKRDLRSTLWDHIARGGSPEEGFAPVDQKYNTWLINGIAPQQVINPLDHLCRSGACPYRIGNQFLFIDGVHLSRFGSEYAVRSYFPFE